MYLILFQQNHCKMAKNNKNIVQPDLFGQDFTPEEIERNKAYDEKTIEKIKFSVVYQPVSLFSLKESNSTNSGAKSILLPSPYSIKMALLNQAISLGDLEKLEGNKYEFKYIRNCKIDYYISSENVFSVNNSFIKILKPERDVPGFQRTVSFREFIFIKGNIEFIISDITEKQAEYLKRLLANINYFGKRGCFFQFIKFDNQPREANVSVFDIKKIGAGILQEYDDFPTDTKFENVSNFSEKTVKRKKNIMLFPLRLAGTSKGFSIYKPLS